MAPPCCAALAVEGRRSRRSQRVLILGLPLLHALTLGELRGALGHDLAHFARGDVERGGRAVAFWERFEHDRNGGGGG